MEFRLGEYECCCGNRESPKRGDPRQREFAPPQLITQREDAAVATRTAYTTPQAQVETLRSTRDYRKQNREPEKYDPSPGLEIEKWACLGFFVLRLAISSVVGLLNGHAVGHPSWPLVAGIQIGLVFLTFFTPSATVKSIMGYFFGIFGGLNLLVVVHWMRRLAMFGAMISPGWYSYFGDTGSLILMFLAAMSELWVASVMFREAHRIQVLKA